MRRIPRRSLWLGLAAGALALCAYGPAVAAQGRSRASTSRATPLNAEGDPDVGATLRARRQGGFRLFGNSDFAVSLVKTPGKVAYGFGDYGQFSFGGDGWVGDDPDLKTVTTPLYFRDNQWVMGASPHDLQKIVQAVAGNAELVAGLQLAQQRSGGYDFRFAGTDNGGDNWLPADGQLGTYFKPAVSVADKSCLDHRGPQAATFVIVGTGTPLTAGSDCPVTWGTLGWQGMRPPAIDVFRTAARANPASFKFDYWKFPEALPDPSGKLGRQFGSFQTYGVFSDFSREELCGSANSRTYGRILKGAPAAGATCADVTPTRPGYPLGIEVRADAFNYGIPALQDIAYYQFTIVNKSQEVYGVGVDYDSLYMGAMIGYFQGPGQTAQVYFRPEYSAVIATGACVHQANTCNGAVQAPGADIPVSRGMPPNGGVFEGGTIAMIFLKSPIGDLRNKLFSDPTSDFSKIPGIDPKLLDDTIAFNHGRMCGFRQCNQNQYNQTNGLPDEMQRGFGMISSTHTNAYGTRSQASFGSNPNLMWHVFRSADYPNLPNAATFNKWVPTTWDYDEDGKPDTLFYDTCYGSDGGSLDTHCSGIYSDTMPHTGGATRRFFNGYSNVNSSLTAGPFALKAGDTTSFIIAKVVSCCGLNDADSTIMITKMKAAIAHYLNFFLGPEPLPVDTIVAVNVVGGNPATSQVTLVWTETAERAQDLFLLNQATATAAQRSDLTRLNPTLADTLQILGTPFGVTAKSVSDTTRTITGLGNFDKLYIFKSCDGGATYTNSADCTPAPATGGPFAALGWLPYATLDRNNGDVPNTFTDPNVFGGQTYTYVLVAATRGANFLVISGTADTLTNQCVANCTAKSLAFAPQLFNPLASSGPNVATVYVPASFAGGTQQTAVQVTSTAGPVPASRLVVTPVANRPVAGTYSVQFFDSVSVVDSAFFDNTGKRLSDFTVVTGYVKNGAQVTVSYNAGVTSMLGSIGLAGASLVSTNSVPDTAVINGETIIGTTRTSVFAFSGLTSILSRQVAGVPTGEPVLVTNQINDAATPETFFSSTAFPGFRIGFAAANDLAFNSARGEQFVLNGQTIQPLVLPLVRTNTDKTAINSTNGQGGLYQFAWADKPFGPGEPFRLNLANPEQTRTAIFQSLSSRNAAQTGVGPNDPNAAAVAAALGTQTTNLVPVKLPFTIKNQSFNRDVIVAMLKRQRDTIRIGSGTDTLSVAVPSDVWLPGDTLRLFEDTDNDPATPPKLTFTRYVLECPSQIGNSAGNPLSCNPLALLTPGATGYITTQPGTVESILYNPRLTTQQQFQFTITPQTTTAELAAACGTTSGTTNGTLCTSVKSSIKDVRAVPNPYVAFSNYNDPRPAVALTLVKPMLFTHVPARGTLRIYTISGQFVQQLTWTEADLNGTGDLLWDLRTREGNLIAGGLYLFMVTGKDGTGKDLGSHMGKFVIIR